MKIIIELDCAVEPNPMNASHLGALIANPNNRNFVKIRVYEADNL